MDTKRWEIKAKSKSQKSKIGIEEIVNILLNNRGIKSNEEKEKFFNPIKPDKLSLEEIGISKGQTKKAIERISRAIVNKENIVVYGDYDADGVCSAAIMWESLYSLSAEVIPYIPDRFTEGYGLNSETIKKLKEQNNNLKLIVTVDNGIVANDAVDVARQQGIDVIITDHHEPADKKPAAYAIVHTTKTSGSGVAWFFARELLKELRIDKTRFCFESNLELAAIGTIADQLPLLGCNRSIVKYGLKSLRVTKRPGLGNLFSQASILPEKVGVYEVGFLIAPRLNAAGRLGHAMESLRLLCTRDSTRGATLATSVSKSNLERQKVLDEVISHAKQSFDGDLTKNIIILSHESYHEGVIGLAASRLVEVFYRPAIVISVGATQSKASARSIAGFNIIQAIRAHEKLILGGGGHQMAAGFSIKNDQLETFKLMIEQYAKETIGKDLLQRKLTMDMKLPFKIISFELSQKLQEFEPTGLGNFAPVFCSTQVQVVEARRIGRERNHLKLVLKQKDTLIDAIAFGKGEFEQEVSGQLVDVAYNIETNVWNGNKNLQLKIKDIKSTK